MQVKKQQLELDMEQQTGSKWGKEYSKAVYCHPAYLTYMQNTSCEMLGWMKHKLESRLLGEISITSDMQMTPSLWQKVKRMKVKEESKKVGLKLNIHKTKITASDPITSWQIGGETMETVGDFTFLCFIKRLFRSSLLSAIKVVSFAYLRVLLVFPAILIPACESSSPAFCIMYST